MGTLKRFTPWAAQGFATDAFGQAVGYAGAINLNGRNARLVDRLLEGDSHIGETHPAHGSHSESEKEGKTLRSRLLQLRAHRVPSKHPKKRPVTDKA